MSGRSKESKKKPVTTKKSPVEPQNSGKYILTRDAKTDSLNVFALSEIESTKDRAELSVGDVITHSSRGKRKRATIILLGDFEKCQNSLNIVDRTRKSQSHPVATMKSSVEEVVENDHNEEESVRVYGEEINGGDGRNKENQLATLDHNGDMDDHSEGENVNVTEALSTLSPNRISTSESKPMAQQKRKDDCVEESTVFSRKRVKNIGSVPLREHATVVDQLAAAHEQNQVYKTTWMPRPTDKNTIEYIIHIGKLLSGTIDTGNNVEKEVDKGEILDSIIMCLEMTEAQLSANTGKSILSTARQIIGFKYPEEHVAYCNVKKEHIKAVAQYAWLMHPGEKLSHDFSKISKAMGNVFASRAHAKKMKNLGSTKGETITMND